MTATPPPPRLPKLRAGQLRDQVRAALHADPGRVFKPGELAAALGGRSAGAVGQALDRLVETGHAARLPGAPARYHATPTPSATALAAPKAAAAATADGDAPPRPGAVRRPNGHWYLPRHLADGTDIDVLRRLRAETIPVLLSGPPGTGKTSLVEAAYPDVVTVAGHGDTCAEDLLGSWVPRPDGGFDYAHGPLPTAMGDGRALFVDDATLIPPKVLAVLYPAMDGRRVITLPAHRHETITATDGFHVIAGHNPGVHGAVLTEALASRFAVHIEVTTDFDLARTLGVPAPAVTAAETLNRKLRTGETEWAPQLRELLAFRQVAAALGLPAAVANLAALAPEPDRQTVTAALTAAFGSTVAPLTLGRQHHPGGGR